MSEQGPKLYTTRPKKSKLKPSVPQAAAAAMASSSSAGITAAPPPPPPPTPLPVKESFIRRYKYLWPALLVANFTFGVYVLMRTNKKPVSADETEKSSNLSTTPTSTSTTAAVAAVTPVAPLATPVAPPVTEPMPQAPIPKDQQHELFKWILEEKRKLKPINAEEKNRIDEEKAILKHFIRAKSALSF